MQKKEFYFKYIVSNSIEEEFETIKEARKRAKKLKEKVYLTIFSTKNAYNEPYADEIIKDNTNVIDAKLRLSAIFKKLTNESNI